MTVDVGTSNGVPIAPFVLRFTARGTADLTFGWQGIAAMPGSAESYGGPVTVDRLGRTGAASHPPISLQPLRVYRYSLNGTPDRSFGINGVSTITSVRGVQIIGMWTSALTIDTANRITVGTGVGDLINGNPTTAVLRLTG